MKYIIFIIMITSLSVAQTSKMAKIRNRIKEKVERKRAQERFEQKESNQTNKSEDILGIFTESDFKRSYEFQPNDEIPWNATIIVYDGRFEESSYSPNRDISVIESINGQYYDEFPYHKNEYFGNFTGKKFFSRFHYLYGYDSSDKVSLNDYTLFFAYDNTSLKLNYKQLTNKFGDENIEFSFLTASPGFFLAIDQWQTGFNFYAGFASFTISSEFSQTFSGLNVGMESLTMLGQNLTLILKIEHIAVKDKSTDNEFFMNFFLAETDIGYHFNRFKLSLGYQLQKFNDLGLKGNDRYLGQPYLGVHVFY